MTTQYIFSSGKGGVGKTSMASTQAVRLAEEDRKTLIVTTDPASNLADVFEQAIGHQVTPIQGLLNLWAMEIDSDKATQEYIDRAMAPIIEAYRAATELSTVGIHPGLMVTSMVIPAQQADTGFTHARRAMQEKYLNEISERFHLLVAQIPLLPQEVKGLRMLATLGEQIYQNDLAANRNAD